jgi:WD40 repeat protein
MSGLSAELYNRCRNTLLRCSEFDGNASLRVIFVTAELAPFRAGLPEVDSKGARVDACLAYLADKRLSDGWPVLPVFLAALRDRYQAGDALRDELEELYQGVQVAMASSGLGFAESSRGKPAHTERQVETPRFRDTGDSAEEVYRPTVVKTWQQFLGSGVASVAVSADGNRILAGTLGKRVVCLDRDGETLWSAEVGNQAWRVGLSDDGQVAVAGTGSTRPWDMKGRGLYAFDGDGQLRWQQDLRASVWGLDLARDGRTIALGTDGHEALLFDRDGHLLWRRETPGFGWWGWVMAAALSADGQTVVVGSANKTVLILDRGGNLLGEHRAAADVYAVAVSPDGQTVAAGSSDQQVYLLDRQGNLLWYEKLDDKVWAVSLPGDGERLIVGAGEKEAHVRTFDRGGQPLWKRYVEGNVSSVAVSARGGLVAVGTRSGRVNLFTSDGEPVHHHAAKKNVRDVALSADGRMAAAASEDGHVYGFMLTSESNVST